LFGLSPLALDNDTDLDPDRFSSTPSAVAFLPRIFIFACVLDTTSWATSSTNIFVSPSNSTLGPCMLARDERRGAYGRRSGARAYDRGLVPVEAELLVPPTDAAVAEGREVEMMGEARMVDVLPFGRSWGDGPGERLSGVNGRECAPDER
jgi:hypothetical protein